MGIFNVDENDLEQMVKNRDVNSLIKALKNTDYMVRYGAAEALGIIGSSLCSFQKEKLLVGIAAHC